MGMMPERMTSRVRLDADERDHARRQNDPSVSVPEAHAQGSRRWPTVPELRPAGCVEHIGFHLPPRPLQPFVT